MAPSEVTALVREGPREGYFIATWDGPFALKSLSLFVLLLQCRAVPTSSHKNPVLSPVQKLFGESLSGFHDKNFMILKLLHKDFLKVTVIHGS